MNSKYQIKSKNSLLKTSNRCSRDPQNQNFDNYDIENDFTNMRIINRYRKLGEEMMQKNL